MARLKVSSFNKVPTDPDQFSIEKVGNRVKKDVRTATFGILQYLDKSYADIGRLRARAMSQDRRAAWEAKKMFVSGEGDIYPNVPAIGQRDKRQLRYSPGKKYEAEEFK